MAYFKEIVTKAVVGKGKRSTTTTHTVKPNYEPSTVLGCWIINHNFNGVSNSGNIYVNGNYDVNIWYSYDNDTKTDVVSGNFNYSDKMNVPITNNAKLNDATEVIVNSLADPNVTDVKIDGNDIVFTVRKEMGIEVVGDAKIRVNVEDDYDDYTEIFEDEINEDIINQIDSEIKEDYLTQDNPSTIEEEK